MSIIPNESKKPPIKLNRGSIINLRVYRHIVSKQTYFVNGFCIIENTLESAVIYTNIYTSDIFVRPVKEFESKFELVEKKS